MQKPNALLIWGETGIALALASSWLQAPKLLEQTLYVIAYGGFFAWSIAEMLCGVNIFRKLLGLGGFILVSWLAVRRFAY